MTNVKFIARQASSVNLYKNCRSKLLKCCVNIYFNKQCLLIPERTIYILNKTWTSSKIGPEDDHRLSKHVDPIF